MWIPPQITRPPLLVFLNASTTNDPTGAKMIAASSGSGGAWSEPPAQCAPHRLAKSIAGRSEGLVKAKTVLPSARAICARMRRRAEAVQADDLRILGFPITAKTDEARTKQRRRLGVAVALGDRQAEALLGDEVLGIAAVEMAPGEARALAEVLLPRLQYSHAPQVQPSHGTPTRSPVEATVPTTSWPGVMG